ncbi:hypothetical protein G6F59_015530 [Rhizopus arrhizus]|nr:hypothetical protein G6F59_015530 [Rhizopus arrhizus]
MIFGRRCGSSIASWFLPQAPSSPHAGRLPLRLAVVPADVLTHLVDGHFPIAAPVHIGYRRDDLALVGVGEILFSGHGLPQAMRSLPDNLWVSADDSPGSGR